MVESMKVAVVLLLLGPVAHAETPVESMTLSERTRQARVAYQRGRSLFVLDDFAGAAAAFEEGYRFQPLPALLYNAAQAHDLAGNSARALELYRRYLFADPKAPEKSE